MLKKISNIGDCGIICDFGEEVNKKTNKEVIKLFNFILIWKNRRLKINTTNQNNLLFNVKSADSEKVHKSKSRKVNTDKL